MPLGVVPSFHRQDVGTGVGKTGVSLGVAAGLFLAEARVTRRDLCHVDRPDRDKDCQHPRAHRREHHELKREARHRCDDRDPFHSGGPSVTHLVRGRVPGPSGGLTPVVPGPGRRVGEAA